MTSSAECGHMSLYHTTRTLSVSGNRFRWQRIIHALHFIYFRKSTCNNVTWARKYHKPLSLRNRSDL